MANVCGIGGIENAVCTCHLKPLVVGLGHNASVGVFKMYYAGIALYLHPFERRMFVHHALVAIITCQSSERKTFANGAFLAWMYLPNFVGIHQIIGTYHGTIWNFEAGLVLLFAYEGCAGAHFALITVRCNFH